MQVIVRGPDLPGVLEDLKIFAKTRGLEILHPEPLGGTGGRPRAQVDFMTICDSLKGRLGERGAIKKMAEKYGVSRAWIYKWVMPVIRARTETGNSVNDESTNCENR